MVVGGLLTATLVAPAAAATPAVQIVIDRHGGFAEGGYGIVRGTATCGAEVPGVTIDVNLRQKQGPNLVEGYETTGVVCDGTEQSWEVGVRSSDVDRYGNYLFRAGPATVSLYVTTTESEMSVRGSTILRGPAQ